MDEDGQIDASSAMETVSKLFSKDSQPSTSSRTLKRKETVNVSSGDDSEEWTSERVRRRRKRPYQHAVSASRQHPCKVRDCPVISHIHSPSEACDKPWCFCGDLSKHKQTPVNRSNVYLSALWAELCFPVPHIWKLIANDKICYTRICSVHFMRDFFEMDDVVFPVLGLGISAEHILEILAKYDIQLREKQLEILKNTDLNDFSKGEFDVCRYMLAYSCHWVPPSLSHITSLSEILKHGMIETTIDQAREEEEEVHNVVQSLLSKRKPDLVPMDARKRIVSPEKSPEAEVVPRNVKGVSLANNPNPLTMTPNFNGAGTGNGVCLVPSCNGVNCLDTVDKGRTLYMYLPYTKERAIAWIIQCVPELQQQNRLIEKVIRLHDNAARTDTHVDMKQFGYRVCKKHFYKSGSGHMSSIPVVRDWRLGDRAQARVLNKSGRRMANAIMFRTRILRDYQPIRNRFANSSLIMEPSLKRCDIIGCDATNLTVYPAKLRLFVLFPVPKNEAAQLQWIAMLNDNGVIVNHTSMKYAPHQFYCEQHFPGGTPEIALNLYKSKYGVDVEPCALTNWDYASDVDVDEDCSEELKCEETEKCLVRCCPITSKSPKDNENLYQMFRIPRNRAKANQWFAALRQEDSRFTPPSVITKNMSICERHFRCWPIGRNSDFLPTQFLMSPLAHSRSVLSGQVQASDAQFSSSGTERPLPALCCRETATLQESLSKMSEKAVALNQLLKELGNLLDIEPPVPVSPFDEQSDDRRAEALLSSQEVLCLEDSPMDERLEGETEDVAQEQDLEEDVASPVEELERFDDVDYKKEMEEISNVSDDIEERLVDHPRSSASSSSEKEKLPLLEVEGVSSTTHEDQQEMEQIEKHESGSEEKNSLAEEKEEVSRSGSERRTESDADSDRDRPDADADPEVEEEETSSEDERPF